MFFKKRKSGIPEQLTVPEMPEVSEPKAVDEYPYQPENMVYLNSHDFFCSFTTEMRGGLNSPGEVTYAFCMPAVIWEEFKEGDLYHRLEQYITALKERELAYWNTVNDKPTEKNLKYINQIGFLSHEKYRGESGVRSVSVYIIFYPNDWCEFQESPLHEALEQYLSDCRKQYNLPVRKALEGL